MDSSGAAEFIRFGTLKQLSLAPPRSVRQSLTEDEALHVSAQRHPGQSAAVTALTAGYVARIEPDAQRPAPFMGRS